MELAGRQSVQPGRGAHRPLDWGQAPVLRAYLFAPGAGDEPERYISYPHYRL